MRTRFAFIMVLTLVPLNTMHAASYYKVNHAEVTVNQADSTLIVGFAFDPDSAHIDSMLNAHEYLRVGPAAHFAQGFVRFDIADGISFDTAVSQLFQFPGVVRIHPLYLSPSGGELFVTDRISVKFVDQLPFATVDSIAEVYHAHVVKIDEFDSSYAILQLDSTEIRTALEVGNEIDEDALVNWACASFHVAIGPHEIPEPDAPNDSFYVHQWHLPKIAASSSWMLHERFPMTVAVIDEGVQEHPDLPSPRFVQGHDFCGSTYPTRSEDNDPSPTMSTPHGTPCAGIIAATRNNLNGVAGLSEQARIMALKIAWDNGQWGEMDTTLTPRDIEIYRDAIEYAAAHGAIVLSNSWGNHRHPEVLPQIKDAITNVLHPAASHPYGCVVVFSAGNEEEFGVLDFPAILNEVISVGFINQQNQYQGNVAGRSGQGPPEVLDDTLDVVAPGTNIWTTDMVGEDGDNPSYPPDPCGNWDYTGAFGGSSAACPQVAGVAAMILSRRPDLISDTTQWTIRGILRFTAEDTVGAPNYDTPGYDNYYGFGLLNAFRAILSVSRGDASGDAIYNVADVVEVRRRSQNPNWDLLIHKGLSDLNCDGLIDSTDVRIAGDVAFRDAEPPDPCFEFDY